MAINLGTKDVKKIFYGTKEVKAVYKGNTQIWPEATDITWKIVEYRYVNNGSPYCETSTTVSGFSGYTANTGNQVQNQIKWAVYHRFQNFNDGTDLDLAIENPTTTNIKYENLSTGSQTTTNPGNNGAATSSDAVTKNVVSANASCTNYPNYSVPGTYACATWGNNTAGTATQTGSWYRYQNPGTGTTGTNGTQIKNSSNQYKAATQTVTAGGCTIKSTSTITCKTTLSINPKTDFNLPYNGTVEASSAVPFYSGEKIENIEYRKFACSSTNKDAENILEITNSENSLGIDKTYCNVKAESVNSCIITGTGGNQDYTGKYQTTYTYYNYLNGVKQTNSPASNTVPTSNTMIGCEPLILYINDIATPVTSEGSLVQISFTGGTGSFTARATRACNLTVTGASINTTSSVGTNKTVALTTTNKTIYYSVPTRWNGTYQNYDNTMISGTYTSTASGKPTTSKSTAIFYQAGATLTETPTTVDYDKTCTTTISNTSFPGTSTGLVNASGASITGTTADYMSSNATFITAQVPNLNTGATSYKSRIDTAQVMKDKVSTTQIAARTLTGTETTKIGTDSSCDNRIVSPSFIDNKNATCEPGNTGYAFKTLNIYRREVPNGSYIRLTTTPNSIQYKYKDETYCNSNYSVNFAFKTDAGTGLIYVVKNPWTGTYPLTISCYIFLTVYDNDSEEGEVYEYNSSSFGQYLYKGNIGVSEYLLPNTPIFTISNINGNMKKFDGLQFFLYVSNNVEISEDYGLESWEWTFGTTSTSFNVDRARTTELDMDSPIIPLTLYNNGTFYIQGDLYLE